MLLTEQKIDDALRKRREGKDSPVLSFATKYHCRATYYLQSKCYEIFFGNG